MRVHIIRRAKSIANRFNQNNWLYLRDEIFEPLRKAKEIPLRNFKKQIFEYKLTSSYPLFFSDAAASSSLIIHETLIPILNKFNVQTHALIPIEVIMKEQKLKYYFFNYHGFLDEKDIDFSKSEFASYDSGKQLAAGIKFDDYQKFLKTRKDYQEQKSQESYRIHKIVFKKQQHNELDLFYLNNPEGRMVISDRMYASILALGHKRIGLEFMDFLTVHLGQIRDSDSLPRTSMVEVVDPLDFGNLTNFNIESRILRNHKKLKAYFTKLNIQKEIEAGTVLNERELSVKFIETFNSKLEQIFKIFHDAPLPNLVESARIYIDGINRRIEEKDLKSEIIILGTSFENHCFYTDHLVHGQENTQIEIGEYSFYLSWDSNNNVSFEKLPFLGLLEDEQWLEDCEDFEWLPFIENLKELHHNALRMMFYKTFQIATEDIKVKPLALSLEYYDKEDLDFICI